MEALKLIPIVLQEPAQPFQRKISPPLSWYVLGGLGRVYSISEDSTSWVFSLGISRVELVGELNASSRWWMTPLVSYHVDERHLTRRGESESVEEE